jgi:hypothetical protein
MTDAQTLSDITAEARRVVSSATTRDAVVRITGSVAIQVHVAGRVALPRTAPNDIDLMAPSRAERWLVPFLTELGYTGEKAFNARHGDRRLLFWDLGRDRKLEVFVGVFSMCHTLPLAERLEVESETIPLAELLLTKLQIIEINEKDMSDMHSLLITHSVGKSDVGEINGDRIGALCARDWGLHHTVARTLDRLGSDPPSYTLTTQQRALVDERVEDLRGALDEHPKSLAWRTRAKVGERVRWYEEPEEI